MLHPTQLILLHGLQTPQRLPLNLMAVDTAPLKWLMFFLLYFFDLNSTYFLPPFRNLNVQIHLKSDLKKNVTFLCDLKIVDLQLRELRK